MKFSFVCFKLSFSQPNGNSIYSAPNPVNNSTHIVYLDYGLSDQFHIQVFNMNGQLMEESLNIPDDQYEIHCTTWPNGIYWLKVSGAQGQSIYQSKFVVSK